MTWFISLIICLLSQKKKKHDKKKHIAVKLLAVHAHLPFALLEEISDAIQVLMNATSSSSARKIWTWFQENMFLIIDFFTKGNRSLQQNKKSMIIVMGKRSTLLENGFHCLYLASRNIHWTSNNKSYDHITAFTYGLLIVMNALIPTI